MGNSGLWQIPDRCIDEPVICQVKVENCLQVLGNQYLRFCVEQSLPTASRTLYISGGYIYKTVDRTINSISATYVTLATGDATFARRDLIQMNNSGTISVKQGTPAASPQYATVTTGYFPLAGIYVPANATTLGAQRITDLRFIDRIGLQSEDSGITTFAGNGTFTAVKTGPHYITMIGGGGGGGGGTRVSAATHSGGAGGGGGGQASWVLDLSQGVQYTITIGAGGSGGGVGADGSPGQATNFKQGATSLASVHGGGQGQRGMWPANAAGGYGGYAQPNSKASHHARGYTGDGCLAGGWTGGDGGNAGARFGTGGSGGTHYVGGSNGAAYGGGGGGGGGDWTSGGDGASGYVRIIY